MLGHLLGLSQQMLSLARQGEWENVNEIQAERQRIIEKEFPLSPGPTEAGDVAREIQAILDLDRELLELAGTQQKEIGQTLGKLNQGRAATRAYQNTSRR